MDQVVAINGQQLNPEPEGIDYGAMVANYNEILSGLKFGRVIDIEFNRPGMESCPQSGDMGNCRVNYIVQNFPPIDFAGFFVLPFAAAVISFLAGLAVLLLRPNQPEARLASVIAFALAVLLAGLFDLDTTHNFVPVWLVANPIMAGAMATFGLVFPTRAMAIYRRPWLLYLPLALSALAVPVFLWLQYQPPSQSIQVIHYPTLLVVLSLAFLAWLMLRQRIYAASARIRDQSNTILIGLLLTVIPVLIWLVNVLGQLLLHHALVPMNALAAMSLMVVTPVSMAYALLQYRLVNTDRIISQGITYAIMLIGLILGYTLLVYGISLILTDSVPANNPLLVGATIFFIAIAFLPVRNFLQEQVDRLYFRQRHDFQRYVEDFTYSISQSRSVEQVSDEFRDILSRTLGCSSLFIFVPDRQGKQFVTLDTATDIAFESDSDLVQALAANQSTIQLDPTRPWPREVRAERPRLEILNVLLILGLPGSEQLNGFVAVGPPQANRDTYNHEELIFLQNLVRQFSIAVERAQVIESLRYRVRELDVLSQVGQAVNFVVDLDDLMELLSAQTNRLIDATHFYIALFDLHSTDMYFAFFQENDERYRERENVYWPMGSGLFAEVVRSGQPLRVSDYGAAMAKRGAQIVFESQDLKAWMGVPLTAGANTLGAMAVGMTEAEKTFGEDQFRIFGDISSLAATSIEKARLFAESNRRTNQLAALNDVSNQLASSQQDLQQLLELITNSAVQILESQAGSLLMTAFDNPNELEFTIAVGEVGQDLVGKRFPAKDGLAGDVVRTGRFVIVNDAANDPRWAGEKAGDGFQTASILAVPLIANQEVMGVLEVLNKRGRGIFVEDDANLLTTFASQAAIAIDNARLFQMTDQQLEDRVEELETLERIDVELNRSLDIKRVAEMTMRWAISQSGATAGALGIVTGDPPLLQIVARYGYRDEDLPEDYRGEFWPLNRGIVSRVMRTRQPDIATDVDIDPDYLPGQRHTLSQLTVPMMQGQEINALLIMEKNTEPRLNLVDLAFVNRLAEHAIIALINAQLYVDLARANDFEERVRQLRGPRTQDADDLDQGVHGFAAGRRDRRRERAAGRLPLDHQGQHRPHEHAGQRPERCDQAPDQQFPHGHRADGYAHGHRGIAAALTASA